VRIGVDVGTVRVGVATSDPTGVLASPLRSLLRDADAASDVEALVDLVLEQHAVEVVVGLPRSLSGRDGPAAQQARRYAALLAERLAARAPDTVVPVHLVDERLTTVVASRRLSMRGRSVRDQRVVVDAAAAAVILQSWLDQRADRGAHESGD